MDLAGWLLASKKRIFFFFFLLRKSACWYLLGITKNCPLARILLLGQEGGEVLNDKAKVCMPRRAL